MGFLICCGNSLFIQVLAPEADRFLEPIALEALLRHLPFSVIGLFGAFWRRRRGGRTRSLRHFICGIYPSLLMEFILWVRLLLRVSALVNSRLFLTCSGGGGVVSLVRFSSSTCLTIVFSGGMAPAPYFRRRIVGDHSLLFFTFMHYYIYIFLLPLLLFVIVCRAFPSLIVTRPGGGDGFLFRPLRIPFFEVGDSGVLLLRHQVRSPWQTPIIYYLYYVHICYVIVVVPPLSG